MNPNHRMPVMVDHAPRDGGAPVTIFEVRRDHDVHRREGREVLSAGSADTLRREPVADLANGQPGPKSGECGHFRRVDQAKEGDQTYAITRFTDEVNRLYGVLNNRLYKHRYLAGDQYTIADMICYPWTINWKFQGQDIEEFKHFKRWFDELGARPAVQKGMAVGADLSVDNTKLPPEEQARIRKLLYNQRARPVPA